MVRNVLRVINLVPVYGTAAVVLAMRLFNRERLLYS
jgi:hypothetical protein